MKASGDRVIGRSGDRKHGLTAETRRRGENHKKPTTEAQRHGEESDDRGTARDGLIGGTTNSFYDVKIGHAAHLCHPERVGANATPSRRTPTKIVSEHAALGSSREILKDFLQRVASAMRTLLATVREIFDESAYDRFLLRTRASRSIASYRQFVQERDAAMLKKPRCC
jgi:hypothetical protein